MKLVVGLGNPGADYAGTRHNVGFEVIAELARRHQITLSKRTFRSHWGEGRIGNEKTFLICPQTYMNLSGEAVGEFVRFYKLLPEDVIVVLDEVSLAVGKLRLRYQGSAGGHNGLSNIITHLHTEQIPRIRIGVGAPPRGQMSNHVLSRFAPAELPTIREAYVKAADAVEFALKEGFVLAMNQYNISEKPPKQPKSPTKETEGRETQETAS